MESIIATKDLDNKTLILEMNADKNSFSTELLSSLNRWLNLARDDRQIHSIILTSGTRVFSVGGDLNGMQKALDNNSPEAYVDEIVPYVNELILNIISHDLPVISVINGSAAGGGLSIALCCDHRFTKPDIKLVPAFGSIGLTPDSGSSIIFSFRFGYSKALKMTLLGGFVKSDEIPEAFDEINTDPLQSAISLAKQYGNQDRWVISTTKRLFNIGLLKDMTSQLPIELDSIIQATKRDYFQEALSKIVNKVKK